MPSLLIYHCTGDMAVKYSVCLRHSIPSFEITLAGTPYLHAATSVLITPSLVNVTSEYWDF
jgi:hypothetical protein